MHTLTLDLETYCCEDEQFLADVRREIESTIEAEIGAVRAPANYKDEAKIAEWLATIGAQKIADIKASAESQIAERLKQTSFDGALGHIAVIGYAIDHKPAEAIFVDDTSPAKHERDVLAQFFEVVSAAYEPSHHRLPTFVGHNLVGFDLRFLFQRSVVLGIRPPSIIPFSAKPWDDTVFDTMTRWAGVGQRVKLDKLCKALGLAGKTDGMDGSLVADAIRAGRIKEVADYCRQDVEQTRHAYQRLTFQQAA